VLEGDVRGDAVGLADADGPLLDAGGDASLHPLMANSKAVPASAPPKWWVSRVSRIMAILFWGPTA
jgi:hypothetical protein